MNMNKSPFDDVRVRRAMQLALDLETLNNSLYGGLGLTTPSGLVGKVMDGFHVPYDEWPDRLKADYGYDPERAEKLLDEAGYPRDSDGVRFKTQLHTFDHAAVDLEYTQAAVSYWEQIGVDAEIDVQDIGTFLANINARTWEGMGFGEMSTVSNPLQYIRTHGHSDAIWNFSAIADPEYDAIVEAAETAPTFEEMQRL